MQVTLNERSRDETVKLMRGLLGIYADEGVRKEILGLIANGVQRDVGRPGVAVLS